MPFKHLNLYSELLKVVSELKYSAPTPIQEQAIPIVLAGHDLRASAQTGTGKTAAFTLPALNKIMTSPALPGSGPRVLILVPTRELAMQVAAEVVRYSKYLPRIKTVCIYGGAPYPPQNKALSQNHDILIATPGRLIDHLDQKRVRFARLEMFILDEADRMLDMGFIKPVEKIAAALPKIHQTLMFSATMEGEVLRLSSRLLKEPKEVYISSQREKHENIEQKLYTVDDIEHKYRLLNHFLSDKQLKQAVVFTATKRHASKLADRLSKQGFLCGTLHGDMSQKQRTRTIMQTRQGKINILVATDVAARGLDVQAISHVINFDLPRNAEDYVHRIGRTGRAGAKGTALSFASGNDMDFLRQIEKFIGHKMERHSVQGMEAKAKMQHTPKPAPQKNFKPRRKSKWKPPRQRY